MSLATIDRPGNKPDIAGYKLEEFKHRAGGHVIGSDGYSIGTIWHSSALKTWLVTSYCRLSTPTFSCQESAFDWLIKADIQTAQAMSVVSQPF